MSDTATVDPTPVEASAANPATQEPAQASTGTVESQASQAPETAPSEETFFTGDPKSLPPELQQAYKNMLKDYKTKTQSVAERTKGLNALEEKAKAYDQLSSDKRFRDYWSGLNRQEKTEFKEQKAEMQKALGQKISDDEFAKSFESKDEFLGLLERVVDEKVGRSQARIQELEQKVVLSEASDIVESFATEVGKDGNPVRPDFYQLNDPKLNLITGFLQVNPPEGKTPEAYRERLNEAYSWAQNVKEHFRSLGKNEALQIIQKKAAASSEMPTQAAKTSSVSAKDAKNWTVREAIEHAKRGDRVPQNYD